jgi:hypothetical protein
MKPIICFQFFILFFLLIGCSKNVNYNNEALTNSESIRKINSFDNLSAKKQVYSLLTSEVKFDLWVEHIDRLMAGSMIAQNNQKKELIKELRSFITKEIFENNSKEKEVVLSYYAPKWLAKAEKVFTGKEVYEIVYDNVFFAPVKINANSKGNLLAAVPSEEVDCFCHVGNSGYSCKKLVITLPPEVTYGICEQGSLPCKNSSNGCGFLFLESCNGNHCNF